MRGTEANVRGSASSSRCATVGFSRTLVSDQVWSALLALKDGDAGEPDLEWSDEEFSAWALYAPLAAPARTPFVFGQIGQSLDGRVATPSGDARDISGQDGLMHLHRCRALADVVVVGVGTAIVDEPRLTVRLVEGEDPARVVIDPRGRLPADSSFFARPGRKIVVQARAASRPPNVETIEIDRAGGCIDPQRIIKALAERGFRRILIEGGGRTIGHFLDRRVLNRLHVAISPLLVGAGPAGLRASPVEKLSQALRPRTSVYGLGTDVVFDCALGAGG